MTLGVRILVLQQISPDLRVSPERDLRTDRLRPEWDVTQLDPADCAALDVALRLKAGLLSEAEKSDTAPSPAEVVLLHLGLAEAEPWLRDGLARGADRAVRVWDGALAEARAPGLAVVVAAAAATLACNLVLTGAFGSAYASGQLGVLVARRLGYACVTQVRGLADLGAAIHSQNLYLVRRLAAGYVELVEAELPAVVTVLPGEVAEFEAPLSALLAAQQAEIIVWDLATLGVPALDVMSADYPLRHGRLRTPRPRMRPLAAPDSELSAFERIQGLVNGAVHRREGRVVRPSERTVAWEVFATLRDEGWLDHLHAAASKLAPRPEPALMSGPAAETAPPLTDAESMP